MGEAHGEERHVTTAASMLHPPLATALIRNHRAANTSYVAKVKSNFVPGNAVTLARYRLRQRIALR